MQRINLGKTAPDLYKKVAELDQIATAKVYQSGIAEGFSHLLKLRASQINQCAFCIRMHTQDALKTGESIDRITLLNAWRETEYFKDDERGSWKKEVLFNLFNTIYENEIQQLKKLFEEKWEIEEN